MIKASMIRYWPALVLSLGAAWAAPQTVVSPHRHEPIFQELSRTRDYILPPEGLSRAAETLQGEPTDGATVAYKAFDGTSYSLIQYNGKRVAFLIQPASLALGRFTVSQLRDFIDHLDVLYTHFAEIMGREPGGGPLLQIAFVKTCGGGCGQIGSKGIELAPEMLDPAHPEYGDDAPYVYTIHEMTHNFDFYSSFIMYGPDVGHAWTDFMNIYISIYDQEGVNDYPAAFLQGTT